MEYYQCLFTKKIITNFFNWNVYLDDKSLNESYFKSKMHFTSAKIIIVKKALINDYNI